MSGSNFVLSGSRLQNATRVNQAAEDVGVVDWVDGDDFIVCAMIENTTHGGVSGTTQLRWRNVTDSGSFAALASTGELNWTGATDLVNGNAVGSGEEVCSPITGGLTRVDGVEREGANDVSTTHNQNEYAEHQWAIDGGSVVAAKKYEFEVYDATAGAAVGTCLADITIESAATTYYQTNTGSLTGTGALIKKTLKQLIGSSTGTGIVTAKVIFTLIVAGSITGTGVIAKKTLKAVIGSIVGTGVIIKKTFRLLTGSSTGTGDLTTSLKFFQTNLGSITLSGIVAGIIVAATGATEVIRRGYFKITGRRR